MKILVVHNSYYEKGGEDTVVEHEINLLRHYGEEVYEYSRSNREIEKYSTLQKLLLPKEFIWSRKSEMEMESILGKVNPDVVHFHNTFFLVSPSSYYACHKHGIPVVKTMQNYRFLCPAATLFRDGSVCEKCIGKKIPAQGILHGCYHCSRIASAGVASMLAFHNYRETYKKCIDEFIAVTEFEKQKFIDAGYPAKRISVKPNAISKDPGAKTGQGEYALFLGRFVEEKGVRTLLKAFETKNVPLKVLGTGPLLQEIQDSKKKNTNMDVLPWVSHEQMFSVLKKARFLVFPSEWYEGFPLAIAEAFACGVPVVSSNMGSMSEIIDHGQTGLFFRAGDSVDLAAKVEWAWQHPEELRSIGAKARREYENKYTSKINYDSLMSIYKKASEYAAMKRML
jgi:glycosyltransferase involved in cell wall biosynthesis